MPEDEVESSLGEILDRVRRIIIGGRWWILVTACTTTLATIGVLSRLPDHYTSDATLLVVQQQIPERYVVPNSTTDVGSALQAMKQEVLSRTRLLKIINDFGLYPKASKRLAPEEVIALMLHDIDILPLEESPVRRDKDLTAFRISFTAETPAIAQRVASTLTSLFIEENLKTREEQSTSTTSFLHEQMEVANKKLAEQEARLRDFKMQYLGELPEQQQGNLGVLTSLQTQFQNTMATMSRAQEQRVYLESLLSGYQALSVRNVPLPAATSAPSPDTPEVSRVVSPIDAAESDLARLQTEKATLLRNNTSKHPDVIRMERDIAAAQATLERLKATAPKADKTISPKAEKAQGPAIPPSGGSADQPVVAQLKSQLEANRLEMKNLAKDEEQLKAALKQYQDRLNLTPVREQQLTGLLRDYDLQKKDYADLLSKVQQSQLATNLEKNQRGQQFRLIDPPSFPALPSSPKRLKLNLGGAAGGVFLGLVLAFLVDMRVRTFYTEKELSQYFALPLVVSVPFLLTPSERRARTWKGAFEWAAGCVLTLTVLVAEFYAYRRGLGG